MTRVQALEIARKWSEQRREVRQHLIAEARLRHPLSEWQDHPEWPENDIIRKLYMYPTDLSVSRLLALIDRPVP